MAAAWCAISCPITRCSFTTGFRYWISWMLMILVGGYDSAGCCLVPALAIVLFRADDSCRRPAGAPATIERAFHACNGLRSAFILCWNTEFRNRYAMSEQIHIDFSPARSERHAPHGQAAPGQLHGRAGQLGQAAGLKYECYFFIADLHALTTDYADTSNDCAEHDRSGARLSCRRARPGAEHDLCAEPGEAAL